MLVSVKLSDENKDLILMTNIGTTIKIPISQISKLGRNTQGTRLIHLKDNQKVTTISIVDKNERWIEANYKESQLPHIKVGNKVEITADAVPNVEYTGTVERISDATGSDFSLIPIDNATGNFVKVEQRVTIRIKLDASNDVDKLKSGYNVECIVTE